MDDNKKIITRSYFSEKRKYELTFRSLGWLLVIAISGVLYLYWDTLGMQKLIEPLFYYQAERPAVEYLFRAITFLGDDEFYMIFLSIMLWSVHKSIGFWTAVVLLLSGAYTFLLKESFAIPRPDFGIQQPGNDAFPSGHTLTALTVWGYLAVRLKSTRFWTAAVIIIALIGFSRMMLGYHFVRDIMGGLVFGFIFMALFVWVSATIVEKGWEKKLAFPGLLIVSIAAPVLLMVVWSIDLRLMGYLAGIAFGYVLETEKVGILTTGKWYQHILRALLGIAVLFGIVVGLSSLLPSDVTLTGFIRYALAGFWVTFLAPLIFTRIGLASHQERSLPKLPETYDA